MADISVRLNGPQTRAYRLLKPRNTVAIPWGRGVGKSWFERVVLYLLVAEWDGVQRDDGVVTGIRIALLMPTLEQFRKVHLQHLENDIVGDTWGWLGGRLNKSTLRVTFPGGSWIQVVSAEAAEGSRGIRCDVVVIDEADDVDPEVVEAITQPWFTEPHSMRVTLIGGTPKRGRFGLLYRAHRYWPEDPKLKATHFSVHATCYDAPEEVDRAYVDDEVKPKTDPATFAREYLCDFDASEGLVYDLFSERFHVREPPKDARWSEFIVGADHGYEDPGVILEIGVIGGGRDATCWVVAETFETKKPDSWWIAKAKEVVARRRDAKWYPDPSRTGLIEDWRRIGARTQDVDNSIADGVAAVADRLVIRRRDNAPDYARLYVSPSCKNLIREFGMYRRRRNPRNRAEVLEDIEDKHNHGMDALRYAIFNRFGGPERTKRVTPDTGYQYG